MHWYRKIDGVWEEMALPADSNAIQIIEKYWIISNEEEVVIINDNEYIIANRYFNYVFHWKRM